MNASALFLSAFTVERYIAICHPMKAQYICTLSRAKRIIICCWTFAVCYSSPWLVLAHIKTSCITGFGMVNLHSHTTPHTTLTLTTNIFTLTTQVPKCTFRLARDSTMHFVMFSIDITLFYLIPLVLSVVLYTLISIMLLFNGPRTFNDGTSRNRARLQVGGARKNLYLSDFYVEAGTVDDRSGVSCQD